MNTHCAICLGYGAHYPNFLGTPGGKDNVVCPDGLRFVSTCKHCKRFTHAKDAADFLFNKNYASFHGVPVVTTKQITSITLDKLPRIVQNETGEYKESVVVLALPCSGSSLQEMVRDFINYVKNEDLELLTYNVINEGDTFAMEMLEASSCPFELSDSKYSEDAVLITENY